MEQVQKRVLCAFGQPTTELVIGPLPQSGRQTQPPDTVPRVMDLIVPRTQMAA